MTENDITGYDINPCVEIRTEMPGIMKAAVNHIKPTKNMSRSYILPKKKKKVS